MQKQVHYNLKTISESQETGISRLAGILKTRRIREQRSITFLELIQAWGMKAPGLPLTITMTRIAPRQLDSGNLEACLKHVQDGIADWLCGQYGKGQDRQEGLAWQYAQMRGKAREYAIEVAVEGMV